METEEVTETEVLENGSVNENASDSLLTRKTGVQDREETSSVESDNDPAISKPFFRGLYNDEGELNEDALDRLPKEMLDYKKTFSDCKNITQVFRKLANLNQLAGKKGLAPLPEGASEEAIAERNELMRTLNEVPKEAANYPIEIPEDAYEGFGEDEMAEQFKEVFHKHNASPKLVNEVFGLFHNVVKEIDSQTSLGAEEQIQATEQEVLQKYGKDSDEVYSNALRVARTFGLPIKHPALNEFKFIDALHNIHNFISEDKMVKDGTISEAAGSARERSRAIAHDPSNPLYEAYHDASNPRHKEAMATKKNLDRQAIAFGQTKEMF